MTDINQDHPSESDEPATGHSAAVAAAPPPHDGPAIDDLAIAADGTPADDDRLEIVRRSPTPLSMRWVVAAAAAGVAADLALRRPPWTNVSGAILIAVLAIGLLASGFLVTRTSRLLAGGAMVFGLFLAIRTDPILLVFDLAAAIGLLVLAAVHGRGRSFWELRPLRLLADGATVVGTSIEGLFEVPAEAAARLREAQERAARGEHQTTWAILRGLAITVPVVLVLGLLLASADAVFSSFFDGIGLLDPASLIGHLVLIGFGAYALMVLLRLANDQGSSAAPRLSHSLGSIETGVLLASINLLFAAFAVAQLLTVLGGADAALERAGLDPKQFARQGFFQLLWVAGLTLGLLMILHVLTAEEVGARRITRLLAPATVVLTILIVGVAFTRISFYIDEGGLTPLRLYSSVFALWIGLAFVITAVRVRGYRANRAWLLPALLVSGLVVLLGLNLANIERRIAEDNLDRVQSQLVYHAAAGQFTGQGIAAVADRLDELDPDVAEQVRVELCWTHDLDADGDDVLSLNLGHRRADDALDRICG